MSKFFKVVRASKFRHVFGTPLKKDQCYDNIRFTKSSIDNRFCDVNPKYIAIVAESGGGGSFLIIPLSKTGRVERDHPVVSGHKAAVVDIKWCPFHDDVIASCSDDCTVMVWQIPEGGLVTNLSEPIITLEGHTKRVQTIQWHPSAQNILLSAGVEGNICIWNVGTGELYTRIELQENQFCHCASFNYNGSKFVAACKDKKTRIFNARTGDMLAEGNNHENSKPTQVVYLKDGRIFTTGMSRTSGRLYALWSEDNLSKLMEEEIDQSNGVLLPIYDPDTNMLYLCGKGDSIIRYYEVTDEEPFVHFLALYQSKDSTMRGVGSMPKRGLVPSSHEIARFYKLTSGAHGLCEVIPFTVPRKSELFQDDIYPDTASDIPALSAEDWFGGKDADPVLMSLKDGFVSTKKEVTVVKKPNILAQKVAPQPQAQAASGAEASGTGAQQRVSHAQPAGPTPSAGPTLPESKDVEKEPEEKSEGFNMEKVLKDIEELKSIVKKQDKKIDALQRRFNEFEGSVHALADEDDV